MNVEQLKDLLDYFPDGTEVLVGGAPVELVYVDDKRVAFSLEDDARTVDSLDMENKEVLYRE